MRLLRLTVLSLVAFACAPRAGTPAARLAQLPGKGANANLVTFTGACDASGAVVLDGIFVLSDDGARLVDGVECKKLKDPERKSFRALRLHAAELQPVTATARD